jgi:hypothetical protein
MADSFLVHERNLDPELRAKVNGIKQGDSGQSFNDMVTQQQLTTAMNKIDDDIAKSTSDLKNTIDDNYYSKDDIIQKDSLYIAYQDINENKRQIDVINTKLTNNQTDLTNNVNTIVDNRINELGLSDNASAYTGLKKQVQTNTDTINQNTIQINTNTSAISLLQDDINKLGTDTNAYRKTADKITKKDLSDDLSQELTTMNTGISKLQGTKQDTLNLSVIGPVYNEPGNIINSVDLVIRGSFCNTTEETARALSSWRNDVYDILNEKHYTYKDTYHNWNYSASYDNISMDVNDTVVSGYTRIDISNKYVADPSANVTIDNGHFKFSKACTLTIGFYGTRFKLLGTVLKADTTASDPFVSVSVDGDRVINKLTYRYPSSITTDTTDKVVLLDATGLSLGRHTVMITVPDNCPLLLDTVFDINDTGSAVLNTTDILNDFSEVYFDNQDNWTSMPSSYNITKSAALFDISTLSQDNVYDVEEYYISANTSGYNNRILYSTISQKMFMPSGGRLYIINPNIDMTSSDGTYIKAANSYGQNLAGLDIQIKKNTDNIEIVRKSNESNKASIATLTTNISDNKKSIDTLLKKGMVIDWYGKKTEIPTGWLLCDGTNNTPNLSTNFIVNNTDDSKSLYKIIKS